MDRRDPHAVALPNPPSNASVIDILSVEIFRALAMLEDTRSETPLLRASWKVSKLVACNFRLLMRQPRLGLSEKILSHP